MDQSSFMHMERMLREDTKGVYNVKHMLGRGGMAVVYLAEETGLARKVALKVLPPELTFGHGVERFKREARTAAALDHPHIIPIYRIGDGGKLFWYAMKYLEGKSLDDILKERGAMSLDDTVDILEQVADALDYAHDHKVIHRDIKPANVMLDNRNRVIVTDFGIAKALSEGKLTATDSVIGTPYFMSPEQGMGKTVSGASDQYSVAVMAYRMLAGHVPFDGESAIDILHKHCMFPAPLLADDMPDLPPHVSKAVARALSKSGEDRFQSVHDFIQAIKDPEFVPKEPARPSGVTVVMSADDAKKLRSGTNPAGANSGKNRTVSGKNPKTKPTAASQDKTVLASAKAVAAPAPAPKSNTGMVVALVLGLVVLGGGGAYWQMSKPPATPATISADPNGEKSTPPGPAATDGAGAGAAPVTPPPVPTPDSQPVTTAPAANDTKKAAPAPATNTASNATKSPPRPAPRSETKAPITAPATTPQTAPVQSAPAPAAVEMGTLPIFISVPAEVLIDRVSQGEKRSFRAQLQPGEHLIVVRKEGYQTVTQPVDVKVGDNPVLRITLVPNP